MSDNAPWADFWVNAQKQFWDSWSNTTINSESPVTGPNPAEFWKNGIEQWWNAFSPNAVSSDVNSVYDKMLSAGKNYFEMAEEYLQSTRDTEIDLVEALNQWFDTMRCNFVQLSEGKLPDNCEMPAFIDYWTSPVDTWKQMANSLSPLHTQVQDTLLDAQKKSANLQMPEQLLQLMSLPAVGFYRESQEEMQLMGRLFVDYQKALRAYKIANAATTAKSLSAIQKRMREMHESGNAPISSLREFYDLWVNVFEETYADFAMSDEYQSLYGDLVNSLMAMQQQANKIIDAQYIKMNLPSRSELDALEKRFHQMRRDNFRLRSVIADLEQRLGALEQGNSQSTSVTKAPAIKAVRKKKAPVKKKVTIKKKTTAKKKAAAKRGSTS